MYLFFIVTSQRVVNQNIIFETWDKIRKQRSTLKMFLLWILSISASDVTE